MHAGDGVAGAGVELKGVFYLVLHVLREFAVGALAFALYVWHVLLHVLHLFRCDVL